ncbi:MAG: insulinase family protein [Magnetococcales bacterium]|nr:insulinase family protein [Magnetococcales bacterium]
MIKRLILGMLLVMSVIPHGRAAALKAQHGETDRGMPVYLVESHTLPMVQIRLLIRAGSAYDPEGKEGLSELTAWMFNEGAGPWDGQAFQERLEFHGVRLQAQSGRDLLSISVTTLTEHAEEAWHLLGEALIRPRLDGAAFGRAIEDLLSNLEKEREEPTTLAQKALWQRVYGKHPYGKPAKGRVESVRGLTLADLADFRDKAFRGPGMVMAVAGDLDWERLSRLNATYLKDLNAEPGPFAPIEKAPDSLSGQSLHIPLETPQTALLLGRVGIDRHDADYFPLMVLNHMLGGSGLTSRLSLEIREKRGLTYGVDSAFDPLEGRGAFLISLRTKNASVREALELVKRELKRTVQEGFSEEEVAEAKRNLIGSFPLQLDGLGKLATNWSNIGFYRRGPDYLEQWASRVEGVSLGDLRRVAARLLNPEGFSVVTAGGLDPGLPATQPLLEESDKKPEK